ncbi:MAG: hypothetical protein BWY15_00453 [Firmicutes bacterium ADurb.Bin193]|nr:MAG: hypothetical protein BWY15_00453 [Firmicutes bacterium ADurb.Bin193]
MRKRTYTDFGAKVVKWLIDCNMMGTDLAAQLGITKGYLYRILYGIRKGDKYKKEIERLMEEGKRDEH